MDLVQAFREISDRAEMPSPPPGFEAQGKRLRVEVAPKVGGRVTLRLVGVPWDQAFDLLARVNGLRWERRGDVLTVGLPRS